MFNTDGLMLTIAPLDQQGASYYEGTVAESREDYYSGKGEAEGQCGLL
jgi:hypothetical protein